MQVCAEGRGPWILASPMHRHPLSDCLRAGHGHQRLDRHCGPCGRDEGHMLRYGERSHHDCQQHQVSDEDVGGRRGIRFCLSSANLAENTGWPLNPLFFPARRNHVSTTEFDAQLKLQLTLQPLSYNVVFHEPRDIPYMMIKCVNVFSIIPLSLCVQQVDISQLSMRTPSGHGEPLTPGQRDRRNPRYVHAG